MKEMTICELIEKMSENETERRDSGKEISVVCDLMQGLYKNLCSDRKNYSYAETLLHGILYGLAGSHFISKKEFEELDAELDALLFENS